MPSQAEPDQALTRRETQVALRMALGHTYQEMGRELNISPRTVEVHAGAALVKLGARSKARLAAKLIGETPLRELLEKALADHNREPTC